MRLRTVRTMPWLIAKCQDCAFWADVAGTSASDNARARAKAHAQATGHTVRVERTIVTYFEPAPRPPENPDGQEGR